jgi:hypothetical protein
MQLITRNLMCLDSQWKGKKKKTLQFVLDIKVRLCTQHIQTFHGIKE